MWRSFASLGLVKHEAPHFSTARPTYETGSAKSLIEGMEEKPMSMSKKLEGKTALVTGGSRGIGAAITKRLARTEHTWPSRTRKTHARLPPSDRNFNSRPAESENRWRQNQGEPR